MTTGQPPGKKDRLKAGRDLLIFLAGLAGFTHEVVYGDTDRPFLLLMCGAMMGLPGLIRLDEWRRGPGRE